MSNYRLNYTTPPLAQKIKHTDPVLLAGSCFAENMGICLQRSGFNTLVNPNGIVFNPISLCNQLIECIENNPPADRSIIKHNELWHSYQHHGHFSASNKTTLLEKITTAQQDAHTFLKSCNWLILTLGSAYVYETVANKQLVANCHKLPGQQFNKRLLSVEEVLTALDTLIYRLSYFNPEVRIILTVSPVRYVKDGLIENNRSKAVLTQSVHHIADKFNNIFYFPAYEILIDDLRDYRFYSDDMVHPNKLAIQHIWKQFTDACVNENDHDVMEEIEKLHQAMEHRPLHAASTAYKSFVDAQYKKAMALQQKHPYLNIQPLITYFSDLLSNIKNQPKHPLNGANQQTD